MMLFKFGCFALLKCTVPIILQALHHINRKIFNSSNYGSEFFCKFSETGILMTLKTFLHRKSLLMYARHVMCMNTSSISFPQRIYNPDSKHINISFRCCSHSTSRDWYFNKYWGHTLLQAL